MAAVSSLQSDERWISLVHAQALTVLLDFDGTLIPFAPTAEEACLDERTIETFAALRRANVNVMVVTGRPQRLVAPMQERCPDVWWVAEHGTWRCDARGSWSGPAPIVEIDELSAALAAVLDDGLRLERKHLSLCVHWRGCPAETRDGAIARVEQACDAWLAARPDFERLPGVEMLEVRRRSANKGTAVAWAREMIPDARCIAIGDDVTDEDMFAALREDEIALGVGARHSTRCVAKLTDPAAVHGFLRALVAERRVRSDRSVA